MARAEQGGPGFAVCVLRAAGPSAAAGRHLVVVVTALAARRWMPPLELTAVMKDGVASSLYVANYRFALQKTSYLAPTGGGIPLPALLVSRGRGAVLSAVAPSPGRVLRCCGVARIGTSTTVGVTPGGPKRA